MACKHNTTSLARHRPRARARARLTKDGHINLTVIVSITRSSYQCHDHDIRHTTIKSNTRPSYQSCEHTISHALIISIARSSYQSRDQHITHTIIKSITRGIYQSHDRHITHTIHPHQKNRDLPFYTTALQQPATTCIAVTKQQAKLLTARCNTWKHRDSPVTQPVSNPSVNIYQHSGH